MAESTREPFAHALKKSLDLRRRASVAELFQARDQHRCIGPRKSLFSRRTERVEGSGLPHDANLPHPFLAHGSDVLERVQMKAHSVVGDAESFGEIVDGPGTLSQEGEESISGRVRSRLRRWASHFSHVQAIYRPPQISQRKP